MNVAAVMAVWQKEGRNTSGFQPMPELAGSGISASKAGVLSWGKEGFHPLLVAGSAETLAIQGLCPVQASKEFFELFREKPPLLSPSIKTFPFVFHHHFVRQKKSSIVYLHVLC